MVLKKDSVENLSNYLNLQAKIAFWILSINGQINKHEFRYY